MNRVVPQRQQNYRMCWVDTHNSFENSHISKVSHYNYTVWINSTSNFSNTSTINIFRFTVVFKPEADYSTSEPEAENLKNLDAKELSAPFLPSQKK